MNDMKGGLDRSSVSTHKGVISTQGLGNANKRKTEKFKKKKPLSLSQRPKLNINGIHNAQDIRNSLYY